MIVAQVVGILSPTWKSWTNITILGALLWPWGIPAWVAPRLHQYHLGTLNKNLVNLEHESNLLF